MDFPPTYEQAMGVVPMATPAQPLGQGGPAMEYKDFVPSYHVDMSRWECFFTLVTNANTWLAAQPGVKVVQCESVLTFHSRQFGFSVDRSIFTQSKQAQEPTEYLRFLRLWYQRSSQFEDTQCVTHHNFTASVQGGMVADLFQSMNSLQTAGKTFPGSVLNIETVQISRSLLGTPDENFWSETCSKKAEYSFFVRAFFVRSVDTELVPLGFMDFMPRQFSNDQDLSRIESENFTSVVTMAQEFLRTTAHAGYHLLNMQSLYVKVKRDLTNSHQRTNFSIYNSVSQLFGHSCHLKHILRLYYTTSPCKFTVPFSPSMTLTCKSFMPAQLATEQGKLQFEPFSKLCERIHRWVRESSAQVLCVHCVPLKMYRDRMGIVSTEVTYIWSGGPFNNCGDLDYWIHSIRLYLIGSFNETCTTALPAWTRQPWPSSVVLQPADRTWPL